MEIEIKMSGPAACGKTYLANRMAEWLKQNLPASQHVHVVIKTTNSPPHWNKEHDFNV